MKSHRQITIRELMLLVLFAGLGIAGLSTGGVLASTTIGIAIILTTGFAIVAFVGRDQLRSLAIGFLVPVVGYAATVLSVGSSELDPYEGKLPTSKLLQPAFQFIVRTEYVNFMTGEPVPNYNPATDPTRGAGGGFGGTAVGLKETPDRATFMSLAHVLLAMLFGYAGAKFAVWVHCRQSKSGAA
jgi:hypothetical protein